MAEPTWLVRSENGKEVPPLTDMPGRLRHLADLIEAGEYGVDSDGDPVDVRTTLVVTYLTSGEINVHSYGENPTNKAQVVGILALAQRVFSNNEGDISRGGHATEDLAPVIPIR